MTLARRLASGFSLIELLVVIAIITLLAALLFPVLASSRDRARQTACSNNERQIGLALILYVDQWDQALPPYVLPGDRRFYRQLLQPLIKADGVWVCPSDPCPSGSYQTRENGQLQWEHRSYSVNSQIMDGGDNQGRLFTPAPVNVSELRAPAQLIAFAEKRSGAADGFVDIPRDVIPPYGGELAVEKERHHGGANEIFVDGHTRWLRFTQTIRPVNLWVNNSRDWEAVFSKAPINDFNDDARGRRYVPGCVNF